MAYPKKKPMKPRRKLSGPPDDELPPEKKVKRPKPPEEDPLENADLQPPETMGEAGKIKSGIKKAGAEEEAGVDLDKLMTELENNLKRAIGVKAKWRTAAKEDIEMALGNQWTEDEKQVLAEQKRPALTFNKLMPLIQLVTGHMIQNNARIQAKPEGGEDQVFSEVMDKILDHIDKVSHMKFQLAYLFSSGERAGRSWLGFEQDFDEDPIFGQLEIPLLGPFKVYMDPNGERRYDLKDCEFGFKIVKMSRGRLKQLFPKKKKEIEDLTEDAIGGWITDQNVAVEGDQNNYGEAANSSQVGINEVDAPALENGDFVMITTVEYWKRRKVDKFFVYFADDGSFYDFDTKEEAEAEADKRKQRKIAELQAKQQEAALQTAALLQIPPGAYAAGEPAQVPEDAVKIDYVVRERRVDRMYLAVLAGNEFMTDGLVLSPFEPLYHGFPFFQYISKWAPEAEDEVLRVQGLIRALKDPQREINKSRSQFLHILNTSANSGWKGDRDALTDDEWQELKAFGSAPGIIIKKKPNSSLERISPVDPSLAQQVREKASTDDLKSISGINADLLSIDTSAQPSGKAIALRMRQAITILQPQFENFRYTKWLIGHFLFRIIPTMFDAIKVEKILGTKFMETNQLTRGQLRAYMTMVEDGRYNLEISEAGNVDTLRQETFEDLMSLAEKGYPIPPDVIIEFMNIPNKEETIKKIQGYADKQQQLEALKNLPSGSGPAGGGTGAPL